MSSPTLDTLPTELVYHLFDYLDLLTILCSFRYVCKRFQTITNSFDRYQLDLRSISKSNFDYLCRFLSPDKISSIMLSDDNHTPCQIQLFLSQFSFDQFTRLQSLYLFKITSDSLFAILMHISKSSLQSLLIRTYSGDIFSHTLGVLLSSTTANSNLIRLNLNISYRQLDTMSYPPLPITLKYLQLQRCTFQEYCMILRHTINLQELTLTECSMFNSDESIYQPEDIICPKKLISFTFGNCFIRLKELFIIISCLPILKYLKLNLWTDSSDSLLQGTKWEEFISKKLVFLEKFQFFFDDVTHIEQDSLDLQCYLQSFQTPFWIDLHHWYVVCEYIKPLSIICLYSTPIHSDLSLTYYIDSKKISLSTLIPTDNQVSRSHHVSKMNLNLNDIVKVEYQIDDYQLVHPIFSCVQHLSVTLDCRFPYISIRYFQTILNLASLHRLSLQILLHTFINKSILINYLSSLFKLTTNLHSLKLTYIPIEESFLHIEVLRAILPETIKHLYISITNMNQLKTILEQFDQLTSVTFHATEINSYYDEIKDYFRSRRKHSIITYGTGHSVQIWLGTTIKNEKDKSPLRKIFRRFWH